MCRIANGTDRRRDHSTHISISLGTPGGAIKSSNISGVEKHRPCASQTNTAVHEGISSPVKRKIKSLDLLQF